MPLLSYAEALGTDLPVTSGKPASKHVLSNTEGTWRLAIFATFLIPTPSVGAYPNSRQHVIQTRREVSVPINSNTCPTLSLLR